MAESTSNLTDLFDTVWKSWETCETTEEPSNSYTVQKCLLVGLTSGEKAIRMINDLCLFSDNEDLDEVPSSELKYLLLPAFMGYFMQRRTVKDPMDREEIAKKSIVYLKDFLRNCESYGIAKINQKLLEDEESGKENQQISVPGPPGLQNQIRTREEKIKCFKEKKELDARIKELHEHMQKDHVDDEVKRDYYTSLLKQWVNSSIEDVESLQVELEMLKMRRNAIDDPKEEETQQPKPKAPIRPFIITKDMIQKSVFGAGYPSIPTVTIEEFFEQKVKEGSIQMPGPSGHSMQDWAANPEKDKEDREKEEEEKERKIEEDDPETLQKARNWDDWKDDHRRGWGNRQNMG
ncbi:hypothetical protein FSP39_008305 [Pinctada imbricata]|uniref:Immunoglobulin-binding protein 1 n=1 Tax=Pinctada imbricata TaxID=66713 RepID=A0AA88YHZ3_PINIB|nr:hypothetical protein FSP39_008305 [Pinctada imbricata]